MDAGQVNVKLQLDSKNFEQGVKKGKSQLESLQESFNLAGNSAGGLGLALKKLAAPLAGAGALKVLYDLGKNAVDTAAKFETLAVSFEVLAGGADAGKKLTDQIIDLASKTPLTTEALSDGARTLLSFGESVEDVVADLKLLGDITGGDVQRMQSLTLAFAQVGSTGRLMGQDLLQMVNAGFNPLSIISEKTGKSMATLKDEMSKGLITFNDVKMAMIDATSAGGRFYGMMDKQSATLSGRLSTLSDTWALVGKSIGEKFLPMAKAAVDSMISLGENINKTIKWLESEDSTLKRVGESWRKYWASKRKSKETLTFTFEPYLEKRKAQKAAQEIQKETVKATTGFTGLSQTPSTTTDKAQQKALNNLKRYIDLYTLQTKELELKANDSSFAGGFISNISTQYAKRLEIERWYQLELFKIKREGYENVQQYEDAVNALTTLKNQKIVQENLNVWQGYGNTLASVIDNSFTNILQDNESFGDAMINLMNNIAKELIKIALNQALKEIEIEKMKQAALAILRGIGSFFGGGAGAAVSAGAAVAGGGGMMYPVDPAIYHSGGNVPGSKEQLAIVKGGERILNPAENVAYTEKQDSNPATSPNIVMINVKAWDGKDVIQTLKANSQTINQIVSSGIKNNNQGLRTIVQNT